MQFDLVIKGGKVVTADHVFVSDVAVNGEMIAAVGHDLRGNKTIDATGMLVTPGAVDIHVHLQMPIGRFTSSDDFFSGTVAAAHGGTTSVVDFVEAEKNQSMVDAINGRRALADPKVAVDYGLHMTIGPEEIRKLDQVSAATDAGCPTFKLYMAYGLCLRDGQLLHALKAVAETGGLAVVHAENWDVICTLIEHNLRLGRVDPSWHIRSRPAIMEGEAAGRVIDLATMAGARIHIFHVSCEQAVNRIADARRRGLPVSGETCPQYLFLTQEVYDQPGLDGALPVCSPPIREKVHRQSLWRALEMEQLQVVSTDHCPFTREEKAAGLDDFSKIPGGVPSIEMRFPALYTFGVRQRKLTLSQWIAISCTNPSRLMGLSQKGELREGKDADIVIFDPEHRRTINTLSLHENVDWTIYNGMELVGWPAMTISRGKVIVKKGRFMGEPGQGRFIHRSY